MDFLKKIFGGGGASADRNALFVYVRPKMCKEVVQVRIDLMNQLSQMDDGDGYFVRKVISATRCPFQAEAELYFDKNRRLSSQQITNGEFVTEADYDAWVTTNTPTG